MPLTFRQIEAFHAVMSAGSVTRAARRLGVSQPAISRMLGDLETSAGFALFQRAARALVPTERARLLHAEVERSLAGLAEIEAAARALREQGEGLLRLAVVPSLLSLVSEALIAPFAARNPSVSIALEVPATLNALHWRGAAQAELGFTFEAMTMPGTDTEIIGETEAVCLVAAGSRLAAGGKAVGPAELAGLPFISYRRDSDFRVEIDRLFALETPRDLRFEARTTAAVCELVANLGGVAILPCPGPDIAADRRLVMLPFRPAIVSTVMLVRPAGPASPLAQAFAEFVRSHPPDFRIGRVQGRADASKRRVS